MLKRHIVVGVQVKRFKIKWFHISLIGSIICIILGVVLYIQSGFMPFVHTLLIILTIGWIINCYDTWD